MSETSRLRMQDDIGLLAGQASRLVADLLALAREDWATAALLHQLVDVEQVVRTVVDEAATSFPTPNVRTGCSEWSPPSS
jgi:hypothetical protein